MIGAVIIATQGSYSDTTTWPVAMFADAELANAHKLEIEAEWDRVRAVLVALEDDGRIGSIGGCNILDDGRISHGYSSTGPFVPDLSTTLPALGIGGYATFREDLSLSVVELPIRGLGQ